MDSKGPTQVKSPQEKRKSYLQRISEITSPELAEAVARARTDYPQKLAEEIQTSTTQKEESINDFEKSISGRMEEDGTTNFNHDYFIRLVKIAQALDKERDQRLEKEKIIISGFLSRF